MTTAGGAGIAVLLALYAFSQPILNERFGWQLPELAQAAQQDATTPAPPPRADASEDGLPPPPAATASPDAPAKRIPAGPLAKIGQSTPQSADVGTATDADDELLYGILVDQGGERYVSPAGLLYTPGSQEGHRLRHLERHVVDDPDRPGSHGVFDGGMAGALRTIDRAYTKAKTGVQTSTTQEDGRTIHTVDLAARVGYVGGSEGRRRKNPMARRVRLVLERNRVITAFPM